VEPPPRNPEPGSANPSRDTLKANKPATGVVRNQSQALLVQSEVAEPPRESPQVCHAGPGSALRIPAAVGRRM